MIRRAVEFLRILTGSRKRHEAAWAPIREPGPDGYNPFALRCEAVIVECLRQRGLALANRSTEHGPTWPGAPDEIIVFAEVPELGARVSLCSDQTEINAPNQHLLLEDWATETPEEHFRLVREFVARLPVTGSRPTG